jgi:hypothetical protein
MNVSSAVGHEQARSILFQYIMFLLWVLSGYMKCTVVYRVFGWKVSKIINILEANCHKRIRFMSSDSKTLKVLSFMSGLRACASWWRSASSVTLKQVQCVLWLAELQSLTAVQRRFRTQYGRHPPTREIIRFWDNRLSTAGSLLRVWLWPDLRTWTCWSCMLKLSSTATFLPPC